MATIDIILPPMHPTQAQIRSHPARFKVVANGRRWGKTRLGLGLVLERALRGEHVWWVAPSYPMATVGWRGLKQMALQIPGAASRESERYIGFLGGGWVQIRSADNPDSLRGEGLDFVVVDEAAYVPQEAWTAALRPALSDRHGGALFISTPRGRNWFYQLYVTALQDNTGEWAAWSYPTSNNPYIDPEEIERARAELDARTFAQEFLAAFVEDTALVFRRIADCIWQPPSRPEPGRTYVMGVDWAQARDWTVLVVIDDMGRVVALDRFNQIDWSVQRARLAALASYWECAQILAEGNAMGGPNIEALLDEGLPVVRFDTTAKSKSEIIRALVLAFERGDIRIPDYPALIAELQSYEARRLPSGAWQYSAPSGVHDDTVIALALAWWAHAGSAVVVAEV